MGLDMYLLKGNNKIDTKSRSFQEAFSWEEVGLTVVGYWRKVNAIHNWLVTNVQAGEDDCDYYPVERENLLELLGICKEVKENHKLAPELLPTCDGFFFGNTEYDEWYFRGIKETIEILNTVLENTDFKNEKIIYTSSW